jgi:hypothetical protein
MGLWTQAQNQTRIITMESPFLAIARTAWQVCSKTKMTLIMSPNYEDIVHNTMIMIHKIVLLTNISIYKYSDVSMMQGIINLQKIGNLIHGKFTLTTYLSTQPSACSNS